MLQTAPETKPTKRITPAANREKQLRHKYGITTAQYFEMLEAQGGGCAVAGCNRPRLIKRTWPVDHCHATGKVRGILCQQCNTALGLAHENPELLRAMADYVEHHQKNPGTKIVA